MTCCIVAMLIIAHVMAVLRRWGVFWGLVWPIEGEDADTIYRRMRGWLARPRVRGVAMGLVAVEAALLGGWLYTAHGTHIHQLGDQAFGALRGQRIVYAEVCGPGGRDRTVRLVIARDGAETAI